jgi:cobalt/nickel transport protein
MLTTRPIGRPSGLKGLGVLFWAYWLFLETLTRRWKLVKKWLFFWLFAFLLIGLRGHAAAHFAMIVPSDSMIEEGESREVKVTLSFSHPFKREGMDLDKPSQFGVVMSRWKKSLRSLLERTNVMGHTGWMVEYRIARRGVYSFYMEQKPYWDPAEDRYFVHHAKTVIAAFNYEKGWDKPLGLKTEIVPLTRPFGLYAGNVFQGIVMLHGKPVPYAPVEVEYYNEKGKAEAPTAYMITQGTKADSNGVFTYAVPKAGWWGFAALNTSEKMKYQGEEKDVELGAILWVEFHDWKEK